MKKSSGLVIQNIGYVTTVYKPIEKRIDITWVYINENSRNKGYAKEALQTLEGVYKAYKQHFPEAQNLFVSTPIKNSSMISICEKLNYQEAFIIPYFKNFIKKIPG